MKKKILVISNFGKLPNERGNNRFIYWINMIDKQKCDVELITSNFSHGRKIHRKLDEDSNFDYKITLIDEPGYKKNVSLKRMYSHHIFAKNVEKYLDTIEKPDIIYVAVPSLDVAEVACKYANKNNIKLIIDIQDLWPEAFKMVLNVPLLFKPMEMKANRIYSSADVILAVSKTYEDRARSVNSKCLESTNVYLGTDLEQFDLYKEKNKITHDDDLVRVAYIGTLGHSYDIECIIDGIKILKDRGIENILFVVMGDGPLREQFEESAQSKNIKADFKGRLDYEEMIGVLCSCDIAVNPIVKGAAQSIINKVGDYAASGLPVINTQECKEYQDLVQEYDIGFNVACGDAHGVADKLEMLYNDKDLRIKLGNNNRKLAEEKFDRAKTYLKIKELIENG